MNKNSNLSRAKKTKNNEFYTMYEDIEKELQYYKDHLRNKVVYCNCDMEESNFYKYFRNNFEVLGLKGLLRSSLADGIPFQSDRGIELLKQADIVVTNPPFSLFREFINVLMTYEKKFLVIGNQNAITYKDVFKHIKDDKIWLGVNKPNKFEIPYEPTQANAKLLSNGNHLVQVSGVIWFTNLTHNKRNEELILYKTFNETDYPKYDNYDAINVNKVKDIPMDYDGIMGVPVTFLNNWNPEQFEIVGLGNSRHNFTPSKLYNNDDVVLKYKGAILNDVLNFSTITKPSKAAYHKLTNGRYIWAPYARILIKNK